MKKFLLPLVFAALCGAAHAADPAPKADPATKTGETATDPWFTDYAKAQAQSRKDKKPIVIFFTGSDWCGWCKKLDGQILSTDTFKTWATKNVVLMKADFPHKTKLPAAEAAQNEKLSNQYHIEGFPTILVVDSHGKLYGESGYKDLTPDAYVKELDAMIAGKGRAVAKHK